MNKKEIAALIAKDTGLTWVQAVRALDSTINIIQEVLEGDKKTSRALDSTINIIRPEKEKPGKKAFAFVSSGKVSITGFGTFYTSERKARVGRNPKTGAHQQVIRLRQGPTQRTEQRRRPNTPFAAFTQLKRPFAQRRPGSG